ncbi:MAG: hypothetical protein ACI9MF_002661, partial [Gammaproteobacteria bacterium]
NSISDNASAAIWEVNDKNVANANTIDSFTLILILALLV